MCRGGGGGGVGAHGYMSVGFRELAVLRPY